MKKILSFVSFFLFCAFLNVNAADWAISISAASFDDEEESTVWVEGSGFDYAWGGAASEQNMFSNERNTIKVHIDGYSECIGNVNVTLGRMGLHAGGWAWLEGSTKYYNDEDGLKAALTADDFDDNGRAVLELTLPEGMKPAAEYPEHTADTPTLWLFQVVGTNSSKEHECGESFCNFIIDVTEEITGTTTGGGDEGEDVEANNWAISATATSFDDEDAFWVEGSGFQYGWAGVAAEELIYSNDNKVVTLHIDGYTTCLGNVNVTLGRMGLHEGGWAFIDPVHFYNDAEEGALNAALTADDFDNGRAVIEITLPDGMKPAAEYPEHTADTPTLWLLQVVGTNSSKEHVCGESFCNYIIDVSEEIGDGSGTGVNAQFMSSLLVYPNPVKAGNAITLDASRFSNNVNVKVYNLGGQVVASEIVSPSQSTVISANFAPGVYTVEITDGATRGIQKVIVR